MRFLPKSLHRLKNRFLKRTGSKSLDYSVKESEAQLTKELEHTLIENGDFPLLKGEKLRHHERRMKELVKLFTRSEALPQELDYTLRVSESVESIDEIPIDGDEAGPSGSLDSAQDFIKPIHSNEAETDEDDDNSRNIPVWTHDEESDLPVDLSDTNTMDLTPAHRDLRTESDIYHDIDNTSEDLRSIPLSQEEDVPVDLARGSIHKEGLYSDKKDSSYQQLNEMHDWSQSATSNSFIDENYQLPMKVHSFVPLETQTVSLSFDDTAPQKPRKTELEDSFSSTEGILFTFNGWEVRGEPKPISAHEKSLSGLEENASHEEIEASGAVLLDKIRNKTSSHERSCSFAHVTAVSDYPSNVWEDVAPTRLNTTITNISIN